MRSENIHVRTSLPSAAELPNGSELCEHRRMRVLVLLRHGRSRADDEGVHEGRYDSPLTDVGRDQATRLAQHWRETGVRFDRVVCSSLVRARETAEIVATALGVDVEVSDLWMERDNRDAGVARCCPP